MDLWWNRQNQILYPYSQTVFEVPWLLHQSRELLMSAHNLFRADTGQFLVRAFVPEYHVSTHFWQPMILVQHLARITGGTKGVTWHILHLNACESASLKAFGIVLLFTHMASWIFSVSVFNFASCASISCTSCCGPKSLGVSRGRQVVFQAVVFDVLPALPRTCVLSAAKIFLLGVFQNFSPVIKDIIKRHHRSVCYTCHSLDIYIYI